MNEIRTWRLLWRVMRYLPKRYVAGGVLWMLVLATPIVPGLVLQAIFNRVAAGPQSPAATIAWLLVALVAIDLMRQLLFFVAIASWPYWWVSIQTLLRTNVLRSILCERGPAATRLPASSGEALNRFRDDVEDVVLFADICVDLSGDIAFTLLALAVLSQVDSRVTLVIVLPLVAVVVVTRLLSNVIRDAYAAARRAAATVSELIGSLFAGVLTLKVNGAEAAAVSRLRERNAVRRRLEIRARLFTDMLDALTASTAELSTGLVLLLLAPRLRSGEVSVGDLALFAAYVGPLAWLPRRVGRTLYRARQASVAGERLVRLLAAHETDADLVAYRPVYLRSEPPPLPPVTRTAADRLHSLDVRALTARPGQGRGVSAIDLVVPRGSFTVVTGAVGSGKTTLLRSILGLLPVESGSIRWNGEDVDDPGSVLVPPRVAYAAQVARLSSATLHENLVLGWPVDDGDVATAVRLAVLDGDVAEMPDRLETVVGPRGVRLSGGQLQRAIVARSLVRRPELLVVDDVSSALDVETETALWDGLTTTGTTALVVSHRVPVLARADQILVLDRGRVAGVGSPAELLDGCDEFRRLWDADQVPDDLAS